MILRRKEKALSMNEQPISVKEPRESILFGFVGAFLFSLVGGVLYYILYQIGIFNSISGAVGIVCAIKGYTFFSCRESQRGIVISVITTVAVIMIAWYLCVAGDVYKAYRNLYANGEVTYTMTYFECVRIAWAFILEIPSSLIDLGLSMAFAGLGCWVYVSNLLKRRKAEAFRAQQAEQFADVEAHAEPDPTEDNGADNE